MKNMKDKGFETVLGTFHFSDVDVVPGVVTMHIDAKLHSEAEGFLHDVQKRVDGVTDVSLIPLVSKPGSKLVIETEPTEEADSKKLATNFMRKLRTESKKLDPELISKYSNAENIALKHAREEREAYFEEYSRV